MSSSRSFDKFLRETARSSAASARRVLREKGDEEKEDIFDDESSDDESSDDLDLDIDLDSQDDDGDDLEDEGESGDDDIDLDVEPEEEKSSRGGPQQAKAALRDVPAPESDDLSLGMITDKLNAIRSGPSFKDEGVQERIGQYFQSLNSTQRLAMYAFLEGLAEVISAQVPGADARQPDDPEFRVDISHAESEDDVEEETDADDNATRVAKPGTKEYATDDADSQTAKTQKKRSTPHINQDADDDAPVMVIKR